MPSTIKIGDVVNQLRVYPDVIPVLQSAPGAEPAITIANDVIQKMLAQSLPWKFNRGNLPPFLTIALQQDYVTQTMDLGWLEQGWRIDINNTSTPQPIFSEETVRDLQATWWQSSPFQVSWIPNSIAIMGKWKASTSYPTGLGAAQTPVSPIQQFIDVNGNILYVTQNGISGSSQPVLRNNSSAVISSASLSSNVATYNTNNNFQVGDNVSVFGVANGGGVLNVVNQSITAVTSSSFSVAVTASNLSLQKETNAVAGLTVTDNTVVWTVANPGAISIRLAPVPATSGIVWQINPIYQKSPPIKTSLNDTISPIPDAFGYAFRAGFLAMCMMASPIASTKREGREAYALWEEGLITALRSADRERDQTGLVPSQGLMGHDPGWTLPIGPAFPYMPYGVNW